MSRAVEPPALRLQMECSFAAVRAGAAKLRGFLESNKLAEREIWACELAFVEGCNNAVQHTPLKLQASGIVVEVILGSAQLELRINDHTCGCDFPPHVPVPPPEHERGRGIFLMRTLMDDVAYIRRDSSNCLVLKKAITGI